MGSKKKKPEEIKVSGKPEIKPAVESKPDQSIINKPAPKEGKGLLDSWKPANK